MSGSVENVEHQLEELVKRCDKIKERIRTARRRRAGDNEIFVVLGHLWNPRVEPAERTAAANIIEMIEKVRTVAQLEVNENQPKIVLVATIKDVPTNGNYYVLRTPDLALAQPRGSNYWLKCFDESYENVAPFVRDEDSEAMIGNFGPEKKLFKFDVFDHAGANHDEIVFDRLRSLNKFSLFVEMIKAIVCSQYCARCLVRLINAIKPVWLVEVFSKYIGNGLSSPKADCVDAPLRYFKWVDDEEVEYEYMQWRFKLEAETRALNERIDTINVDYELERVVFERIFDNLKTNLAIGIPTSHGAGEEPFCLLCWGYQCNVEEHTDIEEAVRRLPTLAFVDDIFATFSEQSAKHCQSLLQREWTKRASKEFDRLTKRNLAEDIVHENRNCLEFLWKALKLAKKVFMKNHQKSFERLPIFNDDNDRKKFCIFCLQFVANTSCCHSSGVSCNAVVKSIPMRIGIDLKTIFTQLDYDAVNNFLRKVHKHVQKKVRPETVPKKTDGLLFSTNLPLDMNCWTRDDLLTAIHGEKHYSAAPLREQETMSRAQFSRTLRKNGFAERKAFTTRQRNPRTSDRRNDGHPPGPSMDRGHDGQGPGPSSDRGHDGQGPGPSSDRGHDGQGPGPSSDRGHDGQGPGPSSNRRHDGQRPGPSMDRGHDGQGPGPSSDRGHDGHGPGPSSNRGHDVQRPGPSMDRGHDGQGPGPSSDREHRGQRPGPSMDRGHDGQGPGPSSDRGHDGQGPGPSTDRGDDRQWPEWTWGAYRGLDGRRPRQSSYRGYDGQLPGPSSRR